jgi:thermitase
VLHTIVCMKVLRIQTYVLVLIFCLTALVTMSLSGIHRQTGQAAIACPEPGPAFGTPAAAASTDSYSDKQWAILKIMAPQAWQVTSGDASVVIAVLDTGIDRGHEDLAGKVIAEVNFADSPVASDIYGHGTHVAGIIAAKANNGFGIAGLAYNCCLMNVKIADEAGRCTASSVAKGIVWAVENGAKVINMSLFITEPSSVLEDAIDYAWSNGAVVVCAAGNHTGTRPVYPAYYTDCLAVAATDTNDCLAPWSGYGEWVDVAAPGVNIYSTLPINDYGYKSGTSMAAAYVSGMAGLLFTVVSDANRNGFVNDEVRAAIENSCDKLDIRGIGTGRVNAFEAVNQLSAPK